MLQIHYEITPEALARLEELRQEAGISTKKELLNNALTLLHWAVEQRRKGCVVTSFNEGTKSQVELSMPILDKIKQK